MKKVSAAKLISAVLFSSFAMSVFAAEKLDIQQDSANQFVGSYQADEHLIAFDSSLEADAVQFTINIDGSSRVARFDLQDTQLEFTTGDKAMSKKEQELMYDTAKTLVDYVNNQQEHEFNDHLVVLVGVMNYWSSMSSVN